MADTASNTELAIIDEDVIVRNRGNGWLDLTDVSRAFAHRYVSNGYNHRQAAEDCGLDPNRGIHLKREPLIAAFIKDLQNKTFISDLTTKHFLDAKLDHLEEIAMGEREIPIVTASGDQISARKFHPDLAMGIIKQRAQMEGIGKENKGSGDVNVQINIGNLTGDVEVKVDG